MAESLWAEMRDRLRIHSQNLVAEFETNGPFPHVVIDNFLTPRIAHNLGEELEEASSSRGVGWKYFEHDNTSRWRIEEDSLMGDKTREFGWFTNSRSFTLFLEQITSMQGLVGDPYFIGGGAMSSPKGGFLNMHVDFNWHVWDVMD